LGQNTKSAIRIVNRYADSYGRRSELQFSVGQSSTHLLAVIASEYSSWHGNVAGDLIYATSPTTSNTVIERLRINGDGNVGIGTISRTAKLQIDITDSSSDYFLKLSDKIRFRGDGVLEWGATSSHGLLSWDTGK